MFACKIARSTWGGVKASSLIYQKSPYNLLRASFHSDAKERCGKVLHLSELRSKIQESPIVSIHSQSNAERITNTATIPLTQDKFNAMTPSMQNMTIMNKVVIITGYVLLALTHSS